MLVFAWNCCSRMEQHEINDVSKQMVTLFVFLSFFSVCVAVKDKCTTLYRLNYAANFEGVRQLLHYYKEIHFDLHMLQKQKKMKQKVANHLAI